MERRHFFGALLAAFCGVALPALEPESTIVVGRQLWRWESWPPLHPNCRCSLEPLGRLIQMTVEIPTRALIEIAQPGTGYSYGTGELVTYSLP